MLAFRLMLAIKDVERIRARRYRRSGVRKIRTAEQAVRFIDEMGFVTIMGVPEYDLPDLAGASVNPGWHVDSAKWWWGWKQTLPERKRCYYAKILRRRGTFISWEMFPNFFAVYSSGRSYEDDWAAGLLDRDEKRILDLLAERGPMLTRDLRAAFAPRGKNHTAAFHRALGSLQVSFRIAVAGGDLSGWSMHRWAVVEQWVPRRYLQKARRTDAEVARRALIMKLLDVAIISTPEDIAWLFSWDRARTREAVRRLIGEGRIIETSVKGLEGLYLALADRKSSG